MQENPHVELFRQEALELLGDVQDCLLVIESDPHDMDSINRLFRAMHSIKGAGGMFGFDRITDFTHHVETTLDLVRDNKLPADKTLIDLVLASHDCIREMLDGEDSVEGARLDKIVQGLRQLAGATEGAKKPSPTASTIQKQKEVYRIRFKPDQGLFRTGTDPQMLLQELSALGDCRILAHVSEVPDLSEMDPESCYVYWDIVLQTDAGKDAIDDVFIFVAFDSHIEIQLVDESANEEKEYKKLGEILVEKGDVPHETVNEILSERKTIGEQMVEKAVVDPRKVEAALVEQEMVRNIRNKRNQENAMSSIRVQADKLDRLVDLVGELVTAQARISRLAEQVTGHTALSDVAEELESLTTRLRDETMGIRMVPIGSIVGSFKRLVRDLAKDLGKQVEFHSSGEETELDKGVIERLKDPLVHIIRNSVDHGVEMPDARIAAGKNALGHIHLEAMHAGAHVVIRISDDGKGLDADAIRKKAIEKGLLTADQEVDADTLYQMIFAPGFSTAAKVSEVSGRGVGMDVVRQNIEALRGSIQLESRPGKGMTLQLKLPLTLAIIDGLMVKLDDDNYIIPLSSVEECVDLDHEQMERIRGRNILNLRGEAVPFVRLRERLNRRKSALEREQVVITSVEGRRLGVVVDEVVGSHQTVLKNLGVIMKNAKDVSGATILGDGSVALILDLQSLQ